MGNKIFDTILKRKIEGFVSTFVDDSQSIFYNENQLFHPGEFGKYRENSTKDLLCLLSSYKISDGFIITSKDRKSSQCDIVIYDNTDLPLLENNLTQFFTIESVIAIGEVKSTLSHTKFKKALLELANNKMLSEDINGIIKHKKFGQEYDVPISFLVCKNASFDIETLDFDKIYEGIDRKYWHNSILFVEQGIMNYNFEFKNFREPGRTKFINIGGNINSGANMECSMITYDKVQYECKPLFVKINVEKKYQHIMMFLAGLSQAMQYKTLYQTHILNYSSLKPANITI